MSRDGRYVVFGSRATNLVPNVDDGSLQIYRRDLVAGTTALVSVGTDGGPAHAQADQLYVMAISGDGRYVAFTSDATNLAAGGGGDRTDVFVRDMQSGTTTLESRGRGGKAPNGASFNAAISADGRWLAFDSDASNLVQGDDNGQTDVFLRDRQAGTTVLVSVPQGGGQGNGLSFSPSVSDDGTSSRSSRRPRHGRGTRTTPTTCSCATSRRERRSASAWPATARRPTRAASGPPYRATAAASPSPRRPPTWCRATPTAGSTSSSATVRPGRRPVRAFAAAASRAAATAAPTRGSRFGQRAGGRLPVRLRARARRQGPIVGRVRPHPPGHALTPHRSEPHRESGTDHPRVPYRERPAEPNSDALPVDDRRILHVSTRPSVQRGRRSPFGGRTRRARRRQDPAVSVNSTEQPANSDSYGAAVSGGGRYVAFWSAASNLVPGDTNGASDLFVRDRKTGTTVRASLGPDGAQANGESYEALISRDGRFVVFTSRATNLVPNVSGPDSQIFRRDLLEGKTALVTVAADGGPAKGEVYPMAVSGDGRYVVFTSNATNLVPGGGEHFDIFLRDLQSGVTTVESRGSAASPRTRTASSAPSPPTAATSSSAATPPTSSRRTYMAREARTGAIARPARRCW